MWARVWPVLRLLLLVSSVVLTALCGFAFYVFGFDGSDLFHIKVTALLGIAVSLLLWFLPKTREWRRNALVVLAGLALAPLLLLAWFDATWFYPRLQFARAQVARSGIVMEPRISALIEREYPHGLAHANSRLINIQPGPAPGTLSQGQWNRFGLSSQILVNLHCDHAEQLALLAALQYEGRYGRGLQAVARGMYGRDLATLDDAQLATVLAYDWAPGLFDKHPEALRRRAQFLQAALPGAH